MKLCDIAQAYHPSSGGIKTYLDAKRAAAVAHRIEHTLIVPGEHNTTERHGRLSVHSVRSLRIPGCTPYRLLARLGRVDAILARERPDVIEVDSPYLAPWAALWHRRRRASCAVVAFHHTDVPKAYVEPLMARLLGKGAARAARRAATRYQLALYRQCDLVVAATERTTRRLRRLGLRAATVPLGVDTELFHPSRRHLEARTRFGVEPGAPLLIYAGRLDGEKRPDLVADAFDRLPGELGAHLVLIGDGPLAPSLHERARAAPRLHVLPYQGNRLALATLLASSDIYVSAAAHETFGLSVLEAQAAGLPVVGVRAGAMIDRVPWSLGHLAEPGSAAGMAGAIVSLWRENARAWGLRARRAVEASFSWTRTFDRLFPLYEEAYVRARFRRELVSRPTAAAAPVIQ